MALARIVKSAAVGLWAMLALPGLVVVAGCGSSSGGAATGADAAPSYPASDSNAMCAASITQGGLQGKLAGATCEYLGIPYGAPPTGAMRFMPPQPAATWTGVRDATAFGPSCVQTPGTIAASGPISEDCLSVNVFTPKQAPAGPLPVMVFIYGGAFEDGATMGYDATGISERGPVIVVTMNYRLGPLGFLALPQLDSQRAGAPSGSDGIRDQQLALKWVQSNIATFHGDPANVTVFGESAGATSTCIHVVSPGSQGLAKRFIMESAICVGPQPELNTQAQAYQASEELAAAFCAGGGDGGVADGGAEGGSAFDAATPEALTCLRSADPTALMMWVAPPSTTGIGKGAPAGGLALGAFVPTVEGAGGVLPDTPANLVAAGKFATGAEILAGTNANEWGFFQALATNPSFGGSMSSPLNITTAAQAQQAVASTFGASSAAQIEALYPATDATAPQTVIDLFTDYIFRCPARALARSAMAHGTKTYFMYDYDVGPSWHAFELVPLFNLSALVPLGAKVPSSGFTHEMLGYWTEFAATGNPNAAADAGAPAWPAYATATDQYLHLLDPTPMTVSNLRKAQCDFWDSYVPPM